MRSQGTRLGRHRAARTARGLAARAAQSKGPEKSVFDGDGHRLSQPALEQTLELVAHLVSISAAEVEAIALHRGHVRVDGLELDGDVLARLAQVRPGLGERLAGRPLDDHTKVRDAVGRL